MIYHSYSLCNTYAMKTFTLIYILFKPFFRYILISQQKKNGSTMNKQTLALEKIALCKEERQLYLDLSHLGLTEIPQEVGTLVWLERLSLSHNKIEDISALEPLKKIHKLSLSNNQISDLSP